MPFAARRDTASMPGFTFSLTRDSMNPRRSRSTHCGVEKVSAKKKPNNAAPSYAGDAQNP